MFIKSYSRTVYRTALDYSFSKYYVELSEGIHFLHDRFNIYSTAEKTVVKFHVIIPGFHQHTKLVALVAFFKILC